MQGKETSDPDNGRQCPFFDELHAIFTERAKNMQRILRESEAGGGGTTTTQAKKKMKRVSGERSSEDLSEEDNDDEDESEEERSSSLARSGKRKAYRERPLRTTVTAERSRTSGNGILEVLQDWFRQQQHMEMQWQETMDKRARERQLFEQEWRMSMEKLERERLLLEQAWREREEQRRLREESRAEKRDALLTTLLNKLIHEDF